MGGRLAGGQRALGVVLLAFSAFAALVIPASAATPSPSPLWKECPDGPDAGRCKAPAGVAADPTSGHLYVADNNQRINEFTAWGEFVKAWGWGVADGSSKELQTCTTTCFEGLAGEGAGQFNFPRGGVAVDSSGDVYVADKLNHRVQKFNSAGEFLLMFGGEVNKTTKANVCTKASGDECGAGSVGPGPGQFGSWPWAGDFLDIGPDDTVYVGDAERIQEFEPDGSFKSEVKTLLGDGSVQSLATDSSGSLYIAFGQDLFSSKPGVRKLSSVGSEVCTLSVNSPRSIATDSAGNVYVIEGPAPAEPGSEVLEFDSACNQVDFEGEEPGFGGDELTQPIGIATNTVTESGGIDIYVANTEVGNSFVRAYGPAPIKLPPHRKGKKRPNKKPGES